MKAWVRGLAVAFISGASDAWLLHMADPEHFDLSPAGIQATLPLVFFKAMFAVAMYLKQSPLPPVPPELPPYDGPY
jgi:hypothetical protein